MERGCTLGGKKEVPIGRATLAWLSDLTQVPVLGGEEAAGWTYLYSVADCHTWHLRVWSLRRVVSV